LDIYLFCGAAEEKRGVRDWQIRERGTMALGERLVWGLVVALLVVVSRGAELTQPELVECTAANPVTLTLEYGRTEVADGLISFDSRNYVYNGKQMVPGPTIVMPAGEQCSVTIKNNLGGDRCDTSNVDNSNYHCVNVTNLHTHGIHVSPWQDNIDTEVQPGDSLVYTYDMPVDHMAGTFWYHAHHHGSTNLQVQGGLVGALIVENPLSYARPDDTDRLSELHDLYRDAKVMVMNHFDLNDVSETVFATYTQVAEEVGEVANVAYDSDVLDSPAAFTVNGQYQPTITVETDRTQILRFINAGGVNSMEIGIFGGDDANGGDHDHNHPDHDHDLDGCVLKLIARDGIFQLTPYPSISHVVLPPGGRADVAVFCTRETEGRRLIFGSEPIEDYDEFLGQETTRAVQENIFTLNVVRNRKGRKDLPRSEAVFPTYLRDTQSATIADTVDITFNFEEGFVVGYIEVDANIEPFPGFGDGKQKYTFSCDNTYELNFINPGFVHPYHQHINSFQLVDLNTDIDDPVPVEIGRPGEWRDVYLNHGFLARTRMDDFTGQMVAHCHILQHEDHGMMGWYLIDGTCSTGIDIHPDEESAAGGDNSLLSGFGDGFFSTMHIVYLAAGATLIVTIIIGTVLLSKWYTSSSRASEEETLPILSGEEVSA